MTRELLIHFLAFAFLIVASILYFFGIENIAFSQLGLIIYESAFIILYFIFWKKKRVLNLNFSVVIHGVLLFLLINVLINLTDLLSGIYSTEIKFDSDVSGRTQNFLDYLLVIIGPLFEEFFLISIFTTSKNQKLFLAIGTITRMLSHLYQGVPGVITALIMGSTYSIYFFKNHKIIPIIIAHIVYNISFLIY